MSILVTGGTGFLGSRLVKKLLKNEEVIVFAKEEYQELKEKGVKFFLGDMKNKEDMEKAFPEVDIVYHLAANLDESDPNMYDDNVIGTRNVVELSKKNRIKKIIFMGSCGVLGDSGIAKEDLPYNPKTKYEKSKAESEKLVRESGITYTIIRSPIMLGPNKIWLKIMEAAKRQYPVIGSGKNHFHLSYVDDVVRLLIVAKESKADNQIFHIATKDTPTYEDVYRMICEETGFEMTKKHISVWLIKILSTLHIASRRIRGKKPSLTMMKSSIHRLIRDRVVSIEKAKEVLDFEPEYDTRTAIRETVKYFKDRNML